MRVGAGVMEEGLQGGVKMVHWRIRAVRATVFHSITTQHQ